nr:DUF6214 family protein [Streptomyces echinoruber]
MRGRDGVTAWFTVRLDFPDGARIDALAVVADGRVGLEEVRASPALTPEDLTLLAARVRARLGVARGTPGGEETAPGHAGEDAHEAAGRAGNGAEELTERTGEGAEGSTERAGEGVHGPAGHAGGVAQRAREAAPGAAQRAGVAEPKAAGRAGETEPEEAGRAAGTEPAGADGASAGAGQPPGADGGAAKPVAGRSVTGRSVAGGRPAASRSGAGSRRSRAGLPRGIEGCRLVAAAYRAAQTAGTDPVLAVMGATGRSRRKSLRMIARARDAGLLTPRHARRRAG